MLLTLLLCFVFGCIVYQDFKERAVTWFLFPLVGLLLFFLHLQKNSLEAILWFSMYNLLLVGIQTGILWGYTRFVAKKDFLNTSFGLGDLLFLGAFAFGFPTATFLVLMVSGLLFSLLLHWVLSYKREASTIPLAGMLGIFLSGILLCSLLPQTPSLYQL
ncbi:MAG: hypothetical protein AAF090_14555 [Bacteroidota bacterium]